ncbi:hypothetical protein LPTSP4_21010 [Leptospira ryugenii]|uniref:Alpha/beta hydrolase n=1 Tax=Leptospira ryugenii TaxID=1917863 RepID=A0A2P2E113_9LEPT|nr:hypothetical protein [Leptospira ryugenii]GBF50575.1 hypothetical protein LPTSP4_21010 [Leptospira ryugenii]
MIQIIVHSFLGKALQFSQKSTDSVLRGVQILVSGSLQGTSEGLQLLSNAFLYKPEWREALKKAGISIRETGEKTKETLGSVISDTNAQFEQAMHAVNALGKKGEQLIFDNRVISSILGSSHNQRFKLTKIDMSFRKLGEDISIHELVSQIKSSTQKEVVLYVPGLFTDETVWLEKWIPYKKKKIRSRGIATELEAKGYQSIFLRFNHGLPIHENGKRLMHLLDILFQEMPDLRPHVICYSLGGLVFRSCLFYAKLENKEWRKNFQKITSIATPNRGSYLEKIGFWLGLILERSPVLALKLIGIVGNLRSDAIKDLSFGLIKEEPGGILTPITRYFEDTYHGELDDHDVYEAYALMDDIKNPIQNFLGDGIVERSSLRYLTEKVYAKKINPSIRTLEIEKANHFSILNSKKLFSWLHTIYEAKTDNG